ncbi:hypothetical protein L6452_18430 [Arctium lappa]|uniref:Uncharacterized protein n=1 Tax=Arctium lappa TaxID=4217 RepID=A0ACB9C639_ARCLA|nr:hypothetical protein L6452_18430 [Arctium lappa]
MAITRFVNACYSQIYDFLVSQSFLNSNRWMPIEEQDQLTVRALAESPSVSIKLDKVAPMLSGLTKPIVIAKVNADKYSRLASKYEIEGFRKGFLHSSFNSPIVVLAPTPANKPQLCDFSTNYNASESFLMLNEIIIEPNQEEKSETDEKIVITRSLFMDFSKKFEGSDSPVKVLMVNTKGN